MGKYVSIAIDGLAGSGKSSISKLLASAINYKYINTGMMYRLIAYLIKSNNIDISNIKAIISKYEESNIKYINDEKVLLNNINIYKDIRLEEISLLASNIAKNENIREFLVTQQRQMGLNTNVVMDGRDIGSVVFPNSKYKFFLFASPEIRAKRRIEQNKIMGIKTEYNQILNDIIKRDYADTNREISPLICTKDAIKIDTSNKSIEEVLQLMLSSIKI